MNGHYSLLTCTPKTGESLRMNEQSVFKINHDSGLHARPLAQFVKIVKQYDDTTINMWNMTLNKAPAKGDSPLKLMVLAVQPGHVIKIEAIGIHAHEAISVLKSLIERNFGA